MARCDGDRKKRSTREETGAGIEGYEGKKGKLGVTRYKQNRRALVMQKRRKGIRERASRRGGRKGEQKQPP